MAVSDQQNILVLGKSGKTSQPGKTTGRTPSGRSGGEPLGIPKFPYYHELESSHNSQPGPKPQVSHWNSQDFQQVDKFNDERRRNFCHMVPTVATCCHQILQEPPNHTWEADSEPWSSCTRLQSPQFLYLDDLANGMQLVQTAKITAGKQTYFNQGY